MTSVEALLYAVLRKVATRSGQPVEQRVEVLADKLLAYVGDRYGGGDDPLAVCEPLGCPVPGACSAVGSGALPAELDLQVILVRTERRVIREALLRAGGVQTRAAVLLGLTYRQLRYKMEKYGIAARP